MKKMIALLLAFTFLLSPISRQQIAYAEMTFENDEVPSFSGLSDPDLLHYVEESLYAELAEQFDSEDYIIENISAKYVSEEYLAELEYNSKANLYFGYTLAELETEFQGNKYVFTLGDSGETIVTEFTAYDDTYERALRNIAIGTGVIIVCVTISVATGGAGFTTVSAFFAASAKEATFGAFFGGTFGAITAGLVEGFTTGDFDAAKKAAATAYGEGFKWGAFSGSITGGYSKLRATTQAANMVDDAVNIADDTINAADDVVNLTDDLVANADEFAKGTVDIADNLPDWRKAELRVLNEQGGYDQLTFLDGKIAPRGTQGATRPDVVRVVGDHLEAVEVKHYDLSQTANRNVMYKEILREVTARTIHMPQGSTQRIVLDVTDRGFTPESVYNVVDHILELLDDVYPNIPIDVVGL